MKLLESMSRRVHRAVFGGVLVAVVAVGPGNDVDVLCQALFRAPCNTAHVGALSHGISA